MSNLFNLSELFTESTSYNVLANPVSGERYINTAIRELEKFNTSVNESTISLYKCISEAETKEKENSVFCNYFEEIDKAIQDMINKIQSTHSRFIINIDNMVDANKDIINNTDLIMNCKPFVYHFVKYQNINNSNFPKMNPLEVFNNEFDFIGQLMQEIGPTASNQAKLKVIATVYNKLNTSSVDITKKCIENMIGTVEDFCPSKFPEKLFGMFREGEEDRPIDKGLLYNMKISFDNYQKITSSCEDSVNTLVSQLETISEKIRSIIVGNSNNKLKIETPTDGIKNTEYKLDTYSMNQVDLFLKTKINQVTQMMNIYYIALAIKLDSTLEYFKQCKNILNAAELSCKEISPEVDPVPVEEPTEPEIPSDDVPEEVDIPEDDTESDDASNEPTEPEIPIEEDPEKPEDDTPVNNIDSSIDELDECLKLFDIDIHNITMVQEYHEMMGILSNIIMEAEETGLSNKTNNGEGKGIENAKDKAVSVWQRVVNKLLELWEKFKSVFKEKISNEIEFLKDNKKYMSMPPDEHTNASGNPIMRDIKLDKLSLVDIPEYNLASLESIETEEDFVKKYFKFDLNKDKGIRESVFDFIVNPDEKVGIMNTKDLNMMNLWDWCVNEYPKINDDIARMNTVIENAKKQAEKDKASALKESDNSLSLDKTLEMYFTEAIENTPADKANEKNNDTKEKSVSGDNKKIDMYFRLCAQVVTAKMTLVQRIFTETNSILKWHISRKK